LHRGGDLPPSRFHLIFACLQVAGAQDLTADNFEDFLVPIRLHHNMPALAAKSMHGYLVAGIGAVAYRKFGETITTIVR